MVQTQNVGARLTRFRAKLGHVWHGKLPKGTAAVLTYLDGSVLTTFGTVTLDPYRVRSVAFVASRVVTYDEDGRHVGLVIRLDLA